MVWRWLGAAASCWAVAALAAPPVETLRWVAQEVAPHFSFVAGHAPRSVGEPECEAWWREWRGDSATAQDLKRLNAYMDERARGGPRIE